MKKTGVNISLILGLIIIAGCSTLARHRSQISPGLSDSLVNIDVFGFRLSEQKPPDGAKTLWDLNADAQSQLLKILNSRYPDNESFVSAINLKYLNGEENQINDNYTRKDLRMVFSVTKSRKQAGNLSGRRQTFSPADRIEYARISLSIEDTVVKFTGWNFFSTEYGTIDIADVSFTRTLDLSGSFLSSKGTADVDKKELSFDPKASFSRKEEQSLKFRYLKLNGQLDEKKIVLEEEGTREIDLTGNIIADVSMEFNKFPAMLTRISGVKDSTGKFNPPGKLKVEIKNISIPRVDTIIKEIHAQLNLDYLYRKVVGGRRSYQEWDDRIKYYTGHVSKPVILLRGSDYVPGFYSLGTMNDSTGKKFMALKTPAIKSMPVCFSSYQEATDFLGWLRSYFHIDNPADSLSLSGYPLIFNEKNLTYKEASNPGFGILPVYW